MRTYPKWWVGPVIGLVGVALSVAFGRPLWIAVSLALFAVNAAMTVHFLRESAR